jgi:puromycin-sensitive aminopeptidase
MNKTNKNIKLPNYVEPKIYDITLKPDLENFTFSGFETITLNILKDTKKVTLHSKDLNIKTAEINIKKNKIFALIKFNNENETVDLIFKENIKKGSYKLTLVFEGILNDKMRGFYKSTYLHQNQTKHLATTQFEATDARRAFPCFDEPEQKAIFNVSLIVKKGQSAISNTLPIEIKEHEKGYDIFRFSPTPKMSTYLLAFIVGDLEYIEGYTKNKVHVKIYTTPGKKEQGRFALSCAIKSLEFYEEYFDIKYPLPTLDMIAVPDFASGAMENWGAITYRESALLVDEENSSLSNKQWVALVIAHELAHQWFGNLVTMRWWTHLWLNEGFASYIEYLAVDKLFPTWDIWTQFTTHDLNVALRLDSLANTHPIEIEVHHPNEIGEIFDEVSYSKGASVIRMLASYLGEEDFRNGLRYYLKKHSYKNTETEDLWDALEKISRKPVRKIMKNWTSKAGYPLVSLEANGDKLKLSQERFFISPISKNKNKLARNKKGGENTVWQLPISIKTEKGEEKFILNNKKITLKNENQYIKLNTNETGFFRTKYDDQLLAKLFDKVLNKELATVDRLGIVRDLFALASASLISTKQVLEFLKAYKNEDNYTVWVEIASGLSYIEQLVAFSKSEKDLDNFIVKLFSPVLEKLTWQKLNNEAHTDTLLRSLAISRLGRSGDKEVIKKAKYLVKEIQKGNQVDPDIRGALYTVVANNGGLLEYNAFVKQYKKETLHEERNRIGNALGDFKDKEILCKTVHFALSSQVRIQDTISILSSVGANPYGRDVWVTAIKSNWQTLLNRYGDGGHFLARLVKAISFSPEKKHLTFYQNFFKTNKMPGAERSIEQVKERIELNIAWKEKDLKDIRKFLEKENV